ncbi:MAG: nitroreductase family protein [Proteobacteria bacterium]|nr:nitroreductase family protein [Pseudomonadota bacterium]
MDLFEVMRTTFAAREFTDEPVSDEQIRLILDNARFAPSGGNRQGWKVLVIRDPNTRKVMAELIEPTFQRYVAQVAVGEAPWNTVNPTRLSASEISQTKIPKAFIQQLVNAPVVLLVLVDLSVVASFDSELNRIGVISGGSVYPFVWNILLAARNIGLGGTLTTFVGAREPDLQALLGLPEHMAFAAMIPMGKPRKQLTRLKRKPVDEFAMLERWEGPELGSR